MIVTVDRVGRIVIPKALRTALGIAPDTELELTADGRGLRLEPVQRHDRTIEERDGLPLLGWVDAPPFTDADLRQLRDDLQR
jgi:AbrB family looped-hinge helix DNA binding protein